jgi:hypothetical protein
MDKQELIDALIAYDNNRARSQQTAIGVSQLGGCRRQVWHKLQGDQGTNPTLRLASILGTAIHSQIEKVMANDKVMIEHRVEIEGYPPATIDYFNPETGEVVDWKTITLKNVDYFVSKQKRWQVQTYGYLMHLAGFDVKKVTLVGIPRDGTEKDIVVYSEDFDPSVAEQAFAWLREIESLTEAPAPEREPVSFCARYCEFYGSLCGGKGKDLAGEMITDPDVEKAAKTYVEISAKIKALEVEKDGAKAALEGVNGITFDGIKVAWSEIAGRKSPDLEQIEKVLGQVPMKEGQPSSRLTVK